LLGAVRAGRVDACTSTEVLQEILYRYSALGRREDARKVYDLFVDICPVVHGVTLADTDRARDLLLSTRGISARDAVHAAVMLNHRIEEIATFDAGFDGIAGIRRYRAFFD
jgi:predicted nucleic acid-binding protein